MRIAIAALLTVFSLAFIGCSDKNSIPSGILPRDKMEGVLWDMILADQYAAYLAKDSARLDLKEEHLRLYEQVFRLHDITREKFRRSYQFYVSHPDIAQNLFDSVVNRGNRLRLESYSHPPLKPAVTTPPAPAAVPLNRAAGTPAAPAAVPLRPAPILTPNLGALRAHVDSVHKFPGHPPFNRPLHPTPTKPPAR